MNHYKTINGFVPSKINCGSKVKYDLRESTLAGSVLYTSDTIVLIYKKIWNIVLWALNI